MKNASFKSLAYIGTLVLICLAISAYLIVNETQATVLEEDGNIAQGPTGDDNSRDGEGDTFSIVAYDSNTGQVGGAGCSCVSISGGIDFLSDLITDGTTNPTNIVGAIHSQAAYNPTTQAQARSFMLAGQTPQQIIANVVAGDGGSASRQYGVVGVDNPGTGPEGFTGASNGNYANHITGVQSGFSYSIQGNILDVPNGQDLLDDMEDAFNNAPGTLADKLMAAMQAAKRVGGDNRCAGRGNSGRTAFVQFLNPGSNTPTLFTTGNAVADGIEPIDELQCLYDASITPPTCRDTVTSLPYSMDFEDFIWYKPESNCSPANSTNSWIRSRFGTPSGATGPSGANQGLLYMFVEANQGNNDSAIMESPCIDLPAGPTSYITFDYHLSGINMGSLDLDIWDGSTWTNLWSRSGDHGDAWLGAVVDLSAYAGTNVKFRFNGTTGGGVLSDMALDDIEVTTTLPPQVSCTNTVNTFPYAESFENTTGLWVQATDDDGNWRNFSGSTPSPNTGPTSANDGSWYMYVEASTNGTPDEIGANATAILEGPCFDLSGMADADVTFDYHSWGANTRVVAFQVAEFDGFWNTEWVINGVNANTWSSATVDLSAYAGATIKTRFVGTTGSDFASDMAIDNFGLTVTPQPACPGATATWDGVAWSPALPTQDDPVVFNGNYNSASEGSVDACEVTINNGATVTIGADDYLRVVGDITVDSGGALIIEHTGSVVQDNSDAVTTNNGTINVELTTPVLQTRDFMVMGSPMDQDLRQGVFNSAFLVLQPTPGNFIPHPDVPMGGTNFADDNGDFWNQLPIGPIDPAQGYIIRPQTSYTDPANISYDFVYNGGTLNSGDLTMPVIFNGAGPNPDGTPNIYANPYASPISADDFINGNALVNEVYFWEHLTPPSPLFPGFGSLKFSMDDISIYNLSGGTPAANDPGTSTEPNGIISTGQGFGIKASAAGSVTFTNMMRRTTGNTTLRRPENIDNIRLQVRNNAYEYELGSNILIAFNPLATDGIDPGYDSDRMATIASLYSTLDDGSHELAIQTRGAFDQTTKIPLGFASQVDKVLEYTISIVDIQGALIEQANVYLIDHELNQIINLNDEPYRFRSGKGQWTGRFTLQFESETLSVNSNEITELVLFPNPTESELNVRANQPISNVELYDIQGRRITNTVIKTSGLNAQIDVSTLKSAVYFVKIYSENAVLTRRFVRK